MRVTMLGSDYRIISPSASRLNEIVGNSYGYSMGASRTNEIVGDISDTLASINASGNAVLSDVNAPDRFDTITSGITDVLNPIADTINKILDTKANNATTQAERDKIERDREALRMGINPFTGQPLTKTQAAVGIGTVALVGIGALVVLIAMKKKRRR